MEKIEYTIKRLKMQLLHNSDVRKALKRLEKKVPSDKIADILLSILIETDERIQEAAIRAVEIAYSYGNIKNLNKKLIQSLESKNKVLKKSVLKVFSCTEFGPADEIASTLKDNDPEVKILAANALSEIKDPGVVAILGEYIQDRHEGVREAVKNALISISWSMDTSCLKAYAKLLENPDKQVREFVISCIQNIQNEEKLSLFKRLLKHHNPNIRTGAAAALAEIARFSTKEDIISAYLSENDEIVKTELGNILEKIGSTAAVTFLEKHNRDHYLSLEEIFLECFSSIRLLSELPDKLFYMNKIAKKYIHTGKRNKALALINEMHELIIENAKIENKAPGLIDLVNTYSFLARDQKFQELLEEALQAAENTGNRLKAAEYCIKLGQFSIEFGKTATALLLFNQAKRLSHQVRNKFLNQQIALWTKIAEGYIFTGNPELGVEVLFRCKDEISKPYFEDNFSTDDYLSTLSRVSIGFAKAGKIKEAIAIANKINEPEYDGILHADIGVIVCHSNSSNKAAQLFSKAIKIAKNMYEPLASARAFLEIASRFLMIKNNIKAKEILLRSMHIINHELDKSELRYKAGLLGRFVQLYLAMDDLEQANETAEIISDATTKTKALLEIAESLKAKNQYKKLRNTLEKCKNSVVCILRSREQSPLLVQLGIFYWKQGDRETTTMLIHRAYELAECNEQKEILLAGLAPLLVEVI